MREFIIHFITVIMGMLLKILLIHIAVFLLTESLISLISGLDICLVIILRVNDLKFLINLTVGIQLDK